VLEMSIIIFRKKKKLLSSVGSGPKGPFFKRTSVDLAAYII